MREVWRLAEIYRFPPAFLSRPLRGHPLPGRGDWRGDMRKNGGIPMNEMERGTISELALEGQKRGMSYGQYVAARFYPVTVVQVLPDGGEIVRSAALPPIVPGWEKARERMRRRGVDGPIRTNKPKKEKPLCVVCGKELGPYQRKYCSEECREEAKRERPAPASVYLPVMREDKPCAICGRMMHQATRNQRYCSEECQRLGTAKKSREWAAAHRQEPEKRYCQLCGGALEGRQRKYCPSCAKAERARRHREVYRGGKEG